MATVKRCDRCGEIYENIDKNEQYVVKKFTGMRVKDSGLGLEASYRQFDLCDACMIGLNDYLGEVNSDESNGV